MTVPADGTTCSPLVRTGSPTGTRKMIGRSVGPVSREDAACSAECVCPSVDEPAGLVPGVPAPPALLQEPRARSHADEPDPMLAEDGAPERAELRPEPGS